MMDRRWNPMIPYLHGGVISISLNLPDISVIRSISIILVSSGPLYFVSEKAFSNSYTEAAPPVVVIIVHIFLPPYPEVPAPHGRHFSIPVTATLPTANLLCTTVLLSVNCIIIISTKAPAVKG